MYEVIGVRSGKVSKEGKNKGKGYNVFYIAYEAPGVNGRICRDVFAMDDIVETFRPIVPGDHLEIYMGLDGRIQTIKLV